MGISRPLGYTAFGDTERTFRRAVEGPARVYLAYISDALAQPTAYEVAAHWFRSNVEAVTLPDRPAGCLAVKGGLSGDPKISR